MWGCLLGFGVAAKLNFKSRTLENEALQLHRPYTHIQAAGPFSSEHGMITVMDVLGSRIGI